MPAISPSTRARRCRGPQPVRAQGEPECSRAEKKAYETKGLYATFEVPANPEEAGASGPQLWSGVMFGLAQASQSAAPTSLTDGTDSSVISDESIEDLNRLCVAICEWRC